MERLADLAAGGPVLEFGIGTGRLALPLTAGGLEVHGVEASAEMVVKLHQKPGGDRVPVVIGDFSEAHAGSDFALVVLAVNTIFALPDQQAQVRCFANAARHLRPLHGGKPQPRIRVRALNLDGLALRRCPSRSYDQGVGGQTSISPSTCNSTLSLKKHNSPAILPASGTGSA